MHSSFRNSIGVSDKLHAPTTKIHRIRGWVRHGMSLIIPDYRQTCCFCREANFVMRTIRRWISGKYVKMCTRPTYFNRETSDLVL